MTGHVRQLYLRVKIANNRSCFLRQLTKQVKVLNCLNVIQVATDYNAFLVAIGSHGRRGDAEYGQASPLLSTGLSVQPEEPPGLQLWPLLEPGQKQSQTSVRQVPVLAELLSWSTPRGLRRVVVWRTVTTL